MGRIARGLTLIHNANKDIPPPVKNGIVLASHLATVMDVTSYLGPIIVFDERYTNMVQCGFLEVPYTGMRVWTKNLPHPYLPRLITHMALRPRVKEELHRIMKQQKCTRLWGVDPAMAKVLSISGFPIDNPYLGQTRSPKITYLEIGYGAKQVNIWTMQDHQTYCVMKGVPTIMMKENDQMKIGDDIITLEEHSHFATSKFFLYVHGVPHTFVPRLTRVAVDNVYRFVAYLKKAPPEIFLASYQLQIIQVRAEEVIEYDGIVKVVASLYDVHVSEARVRKRVEVLAKRCFPEEEIAVEEADVLPPDKI